ERSDSAMRRYQMSKAANLYFTLELARRCRAAEIGVTPVACHPGVADTELSRTFPAWFSILAPILRPLFNSPAEGALPTLMAATLPEVSPGDYFGPTRRGETAHSAGKAKIADHIRDEETAARLWDLSEQLTGVSYPAPRA
ncbi:MAG: short chain dehydrogenase, partial [Myxococcales bacterium]|nr:short chain dehydrogenase [Myxococcales bacterium]